MIEKAQQIPTYWLSLETCEIIYNEFREFQVTLGPLPPFDSRYPEKLESILGSVKQHAFGVRVFPTIAEATAGYFYKVCTGHPFQNGNKRMAIIFSHIFLRLHDIDYNLSFDKMYTLATVVASASENGARPENVYQFTREIISDHLT